MSDHPIGFVQSIGPALGSAAPSSAAPLPSQTAPTGAGFHSILMNSLNQVNELQTEADLSVERLLTGESENVAEVLAAVNKAGIAFDLLMEIRNKLIDAYKEIQQMQV